MSVLRKDIEEADQLFAILRHQQAQARNTIQRLVGLYAAMKDKAPRVVVSRRSSRFVAVKLTDEVSRHLRSKGLNHPDSPLHYELFKAQDLEKRGKVRIVPGQDMDPGQIEVISEAEGIPDRMKVIDDLEKWIVRFPITNNSRG